MVDIFNEKYVHITGRTLGVNDIQIFAKKRGDYIFRVSLMPAAFREDEPDVYDVPYIRYMIIEIGKDKNGDTIIKDYVFFDLALPDDDMMERMKAKIVETAEGSLVNAIIDREGLGDDSVCNRSSSSGKAHEADVGYF